MKPIDPHTPMMNRWWLKHQFDDARLDGYPTELPRRVVPKMAFNFCTDPLHGGADLSRLRDGVHTLNEDTPMPIEIRSRM